MAKIRLKVSPKVAAVVKKNPDYWSRRFATATARFLELLSLLERVLGRHLTRIESDKLMVVVARQTHSPTLSALFTPSAFR